MNRVSRIVGHILDRRSLGNENEDVDSSCLKRQISQNGVTGLVTQQLAGKCAIVTGAASGIGAATAELFVRHGAKVVCVDVAEADLDQVVKDIVSEFPGSAVALRADVSSNTDTEKMIKVCIDTFGKLDVFFANAGILKRFVPITDEEEIDFMKTIATNSLSVFMAIKYAGDYMAKHDGGSIICTASIAGLRADMTPLQYTASKGAVLSMIKSANDRLQMSGVRVNGVVPGGVMTPIVMKVAKDMLEDGLEMKGYSTKRFPPIDPMSIAEVVAFLASDASRAIKGQALIADGGMINSMGSQPYPSKIKK